VESGEQEDFLKNTECDKAQGYLYSRPVPYKDAEALMKNFDAQITIS
jgi:EAL domain-containing protein (putative c-di-GMP-specific phosphodiesterase class I)